MFARTAVQYQAVIWIYACKGARHFVALPKEAAAEIRFFSPNAKGFMPVAVHASIGAYVLAINREIRKAQGIGDG